VSSCWPKEFVSLQGFMPTNRPQVRAKMLERKGKTGNKIETTIGRIRFTIPLRFIYSICQTLYLARAWHHTRPQTEENFSTLPTHHWE